MSTTHFGFQSVDEKEKAQRVRGVFDSVASKYDVMNDLMSGGLHRAWKAYTVMVANLREGSQVLDIAGGTGDLSLAFAKKVGTTGRVVHTDINEAMLRTGRNRLIDAGVILPTLVCDAEQLPFPDAHFDVVSVAFGLRNMTHKDRALTEMCRVLKPGGKLLVLEWQSRWRRFTTGIPSRSCPSWARWWRAMTPATATWPSPFGCTPVRKNSNPSCNKAALGMWTITT